eukprot:3654863-Karenia_brevis.AAC.1
MGISSRSAAQVIAKNTPHQPDYIVTFWDEQDQPTVKIRCPAIGPPPGAIVTDVAQPSLFDWMYEEDIHEPKSWDFARWAE